MNDSWHKVLDMNMSLSQLSYVPEAVICASVSRYSDVASIWRWPHSLSPTARPPVSTVDKTAQQDPITKPTVQTTELHIPSTYSRYVHVCITGQCCMLNCTYVLLGHIHNITYYTVYTHDIYNTMYIHTLHTILYIRTYVCNV